MYNHYIDTFLVVVACGSFHKASELIHLSSTGIQKQMSALEKSVGVSLFERGKKGSTLTGHGKMFLQECHRLIDVSEDILQKTRGLADSESAPIRIGTSLLSPIEEFNRICRSSASLQSYAIQMISLEHELNLDVSTGAESAEISFGIEPNISAFDGTDFLPFTKYHLTCAVPVGHPLSQKDRLTISDLEGETLYFPSRGNPRFAMAFSSIMRKEHPEVKIVSPSVYYDLKSMNRCIEEKRIVLFLDCWNNIHPGLVNLPVEWDWTVPCGLIWKKDARKKVLDFIEDFRSIVTSPVT